MSEKAISRREFLQTSSLIGAGLVWWWLGNSSSTAEAAESLPSILHPEQGTEATIRSTRLELDLHFTSFQNTATDFVTETNHLWDQYALDHDQPSPAIIEATYTKFGASAVAHGQLKVVTTELRRQLESGQRTRDSLTPQEQVLLTIRQAVDESKIEETIALNAQEFEPAFQNILMQLGYDGVIALKSPSDLGRTGKVYLWNRLTEKWSSPVNVVVLNTAQFETWLNLKDSANGLAGLDLPYPHQARWMIEISDEVISRGACEYDQTHSSSTWARFVDDTVPETYQVEFPRYDVESKTLHPSARFFALRVASLLDQSADASPLAELMANLPPQFDFTQNEVARTLSLSEDTFVSYILMQWAAESKLHLPPFAGADQQQLREAMLQTPDVLETRNGFPLNKYLVLTWVQLAFQAGILDRQILTTVGESRELVPDQKHAFIAIEDYSHDTHLQLKTIGLLVNDISQQCYWFDDQAQLQTTSLTELVASCTQNQPMVRVVVYRAHP